MNYGIQKLISNDGKVCDCCGKVHSGLLRRFIEGECALSSISGLVGEYKAKKAYILCDRNTFEAAGRKVKSILESDGVKVNLHIIDRERVMPDEKTLGEAVMFIHPDDEIVIAVGSGVINDTGKIVAKLKGVPDIIVATAPSMDGFASATSSVEREGLKVSLPSKCPDAVIADREILKTAPRFMVLSGIGDMIAKYVSIAEWKIAHLLFGEYYCDEIAELINSSLDKVIKVSEKALAGDGEALEALCEALTVSGMCMNYAGLSRPASGMEHYISHIIDMRSLEFGSASSLHGIQCAIATLDTIRGYEKLYETIPDYDYAINKMNSFDIDEWNSFLREKLGHGAESMIRIEMVEGKYDKEKHKKRLDVIISHYEEIKEIILSLPSSAELESFMKTIGLSTEWEEIGVSAEEARDAFIMAKDIRDKYVLGRLLFDLGLL